MRHIITILFATLLFTSAQAQIPYCLNGVEVELSAIGTAEITPEMIDAGSEDAASMTVSPSSFTCADLGPVDVTLTVTDTEGNSASCVTTVFVLDRVNPVAICDQAFTVELNSQGEWITDPNMIDDGSFDFCTPVTLTTEPAVISCNDANPALVVLTVTDVYGNINYCYTEVSYTLPQGNQNLACNDGQVIYIQNENPVEITPDMLLEGTYLQCNDLYGVSLSVDGNPLPGNTVDQTHIGDTVIAQITEISSGNSCWGSLIIEQLNCDPFTICDTECNATAVGDCDSGHTLEDGIEWPCDIIIASTQEYPSPLYLTSSGLVDEADAAPVLFTEPCHIVAYAWNDVVFVEEGEAYRIEREWIVVNWITMDIWNYDQVIEIAVDPLQICDTEPWNAPEGMCSNGTTGDDVEWPGNDTIYNVSIDPVELAQNPDVHPNNAEPEILNSQAPSSTRYQDDIEVVSDGYAIIHRAWTVLDLIDSTEYTYEQALHVFSDLTTANVCVSSLLNEPVQDVQLPSGFSDETGCETIDVVPGLIITPTKDDQTAQGIDILDEVLMKEFILGMTIPTPEQRIAADINGNGQITTLDLVFLQKLLEGTPYPNDSWRFFDRTDNPNPDFEGPLNESITVGRIPDAYKFIGIKLGDVDFSYGEEDLTANAPFVDMHMMDEILNNGEQYLPSIFSKERIAIQGLSMDIDMSSEKISITNVTSNVLPDFSFDEHVRIENDKMIIRYSAPRDVMQTSDIVIMPEEFILEFEISATGNGILSDEFKLSSDDLQFLKLRSSNDHVQVRLNWDDEIVSGIRRPQLEGVEVFPTPATNMVTITYDNTLQLDFAITDLSGRHLTAGTLQENTIDVSRIQNGLYLLTLSDHEGKQSTHKLIIQR